MTQRNRQVIRRFCLGATALLVLSAGVVLVSNDSDPGGNSLVPQAGGKVLFSGEASLDFAQETLSDIVSWSDQVALVTAIREDPIPDDPPPARAQAGEGAEVREVTFVVNRVVWHLDGRPMLESGSFSGLFDGH